MKIMPHYNLTCLLTFPWNIVTQIQFQTSSKLCTGSLMQTRHTSVMKTSLQQTGFFLEASLRTRCPMSLLNASVPLSTTFDSLCLSSSLLLPVLALWHCLCPVYQWRLRPRIRGRVTHNRRVMGCWSKTEKVESITVTCVFVHRKGYIYVCVWVCLCVCGAMGWSGEAIILPKIL